MSESVDNIEKELAQGLKNAGNDNIRLDRDVDASMDAIAKPIAEAIRKGYRLDYRGTATSTQINEDTTLVNGSMYVCTDGGILDGSEPLYVMPNTAVIWDGEKWSEFLHFDMSAYATKNALDSESMSRAGADAGLMQSIEAEAETRASADSSIINRLDEFETKTDAKSKVNNYGLLMRGNGENTLQFCRPTLEI